MNTIQEVQQRAQLIRIQTSHYRLFDLGHPGQRLGNQRDSRGRSGTDHLAPIGPSRPHHEPPALEPIHQSSDPGGPLQKPIRHDKGRQPRLAGFYQDPKHIELLQRNPVGREIPLESPPNSLRNPQQRPYGRPLS